MVTAPSTLLGKVLCRLGIHDMWTYDTTPTGWVYECRLCGHRPAGKVEAKSEAPEDAKFKQAP